MLLPNIFFRNFYSQKAPSLLKKNILDPEKNTDEVKKHISDYCKRRREVALVNH